MSIMNRVRDLRHQARIAQERAAQASMAEDKASWLTLARRWNQLADAEAAHQPPWPISTRHDLSPFLTSR